MYLKAEHANSVITACITKEPQLKNSKWAPFLLPGILEKCLLALQFSECSDKWPGRRAACVHVSAVWTLTLRNSLSHKTPGKPCLQAGYDSTASAFPGNRCAPGPSPQSGEWRTPPPAAAWPGAVVGGWRGGFSGVCVGEVIFLFTFYDSTAFTNVKLTLHSWDRLCLGRRCYPLCVYCWIQFADILFITFVFMWPSVL